MPAGELSPAESSQNQGQFKREHQGVRKNWNLPQDFPNANVVRAYTEVGAWDLFCIE